MSYNKQLLKGIAINFHFTRKCNFECKFCFHTKKTSYILPLEKQIKMIQDLKEYGAEKINFAGGEPFLYPEVLGNLVKASKECGYDSVSIISNGSKLKTSWMEKYGKWLDIMGTSCDTIDPEINFKHGRKIAGSYKVHDDSDNIRKCAKISKDHNIMFKINTVVTALNKHEDLSAFINEINPMRWKVFQVLPIEGENYNNTDMETLSKLLITSTDFHNYVERNKTGLKKKEIIKPENNETMLTSYILIDEYGRFLDCSKGAKTTTPSILEVGIEKAYQILIGNDGKGFNTDLFKDRGGYYPEEWKKSKRI